MTDDAPPEHRGRGWNLRGQKSGGRTKGTPNKVTKEFREIVQNLIDKNAENVETWLEQVALGVPAETREVEGSTIVVRPGVAPNPEKALDLLNKLAEYAAPKLSRSEITGPGGAPLMPPSVHVSIESKPPEES